MKSQKQFCEMFNKHKHGMMHFVNAVCFLSVLLFAVNLVSWVYRANNIESREEILGLQNLEGDVDVLNIGSSNFLRYFIPLKAYEDYGITSYNYATVLGQIDMIRYYMEEAEKYKTPELYVINMGGLLYMSEEVSEQGIRNWSDSLDIWNFTRLKSIHSYLKSHDSSSVDILSYYFDLAKYHADKVSLENIIQYMRLQDNYQNIDRGFSASTGFQPFDTPAVCDEIGELTEQEYNAVTELLDYCDKKEHNVLFMVSPFFITEDDWLKLNAAEALITERGYRFVNFNRYYKEMGIDFGVDYADKGHVNYFGAEKFTDFFANYLKENYGLSDHREDERYRSWNEDAVLFENDQNNWRTETESNIRSAMTDSFEE